MNWIETVTNLPSSDFNVPCTYITTFAYWWDNVPKCNVSRISWSKNFEIQFAWYIFNFMTLELQIYLMFTSKLVYRYSSLTASIKVRSQKSWVNNQRVGKYNWSLSMPNTRSPLRTWLWNIELHQDIIEIQQL